jgi:hypothetical protein
VRSASQGLVETDNRSLVRTRIGLTFCLGLALALRLWGVADRLPDPTLGINVIDDSVVEEADRTTMARAWAMWGGGALPLNLDPQTAGWPGLSFYVALVAQVAYRGYWQLFEGGGGTEQFVRHAAAHPDRLILFARLFGVTLGVLTVWVTYRVGRSLLTPGVGLIAALLLAVNPLHVLTSQHTSDPNLLATLFALLATVPLCTIGSNGRLAPSILAGSMIGLATASKYVPAILVFPLIWRHLQWFRSEKSQRAVAVRALILSLMGVIVAFVAASPFTFLKGATFSRDFEVQSASLLSDWTGQSEFPVALPTYILSVLPSALGWVTALLAVAGLALLWRKGGAARALVTIPLLIVAGNGLLKVAQPRYILPAIPFLMVAAAFSLVAMARTRWLTSNATMGRAGLLVCVAAMCVPQVVELTRARRALAMPDTRHVARRWINSHIPPAVPMVVELYGPVINSRNTERLALTWPFFASQPERVGPSYRSEYLDGFQLYVASSEISGRFRSQPGKYRDEVAYYAWLQAHTSVAWRSDSAKASGPLISILSLPRAISAATVRDSLWRAEPKEGIDSLRLAAWCRDASVLFMLAQDQDRAAEWAERGMTIAPVSERPKLLSLLAWTRLQQGQLDTAADAAVRGIGVSPQDPTLHLYLGMAYQRMGKIEAALAEYENSLRIAPTQDGWQMIQAEIAKLESGRRPSR